ncbi:MAG: alpha/beta hydrolase-fold protein [Gemmatimonadota bacterium]
MSLESLSHIPEGARDGSPLVVLLHGRGSDEHDLQGIVSFLPPDAILVTPRAPFPGAPWGYGPGWAWYRYSGGRRVADETLEEGLTALDDFLDTLGANLPVRPGPKILGGFSQGGTMGLAWALSRPGQLSGVAVLSGFLVESPVVEMGPGSAAGLEVFWGHGRADPNIPFTMAEESRRILGEAGAVLDTVDHPGGHQISPGELRAFRRWLDRVAAEKA